MMKIVISGITGQDGYCLSKLLVSNGHEVHGIARRNSQKSLGVLDTDPELKSKLKLHYGDVTDKHSLDGVFGQVRPDRVYHLAAQSFVQESWSNPELTYEVNIKGTLNMLNSFREYSPQGRFYFASSSEMFGKVDTKSQDERTFPWPRSPYGISKLAGFYTGVNYRESYDLFVSNGILFNHESPHRGEEFVTRKISLAAVKIHLGLEKELVLGNLDAQRDWGYAEDYVKAMEMILEHDKPDDFVVATGETHSVREFVETAFSHLGLDWNKHVRVDERFKRPADVVYLCGNASKAKKLLGWKPTVSFEELVGMMVDADLRRLSARKKTAE
jgi:GDPmannose 4,6-dehydratase